MLSAEPADLARLARLRYVSDEESGYSRRRNCRGFVYLNERGGAIRDPRKLRRIESLVIPPAWRDVWICRVANGHLQATGRDARQRKQYLYHERWQHIASLAKFARMEQFGRNLPRLRRAIAADLAGRKLTRRRVLAGMAALLDATGIRVGNEEYVKENGSFGLTTLRDRHVVAAGAGVELRFRAKGGLPRVIAVDDKALVRFLRTCAAVKGRRLFQFVEADEPVRPVQSADVNEYLQEIAGEAITAKDFRTWRASSLAAGMLCGAAEMTSQRARKRAVREVVCAAAELISNTAAVCRNYYIHPGLLETFEAGAWGECFGGFSPDRRRRLSHQEQALVHFLSWWRPERLD